MHALCVGIGGMGKSTLCFTLAQQHVDRSEGVLIADPNDDPNWPSGPLVRKLPPGPDLALRLMELAKRSKRCALFVEEAGETIGHGKTATDAQWLLTRCRHWGHRTYVIAQRANLVPPTVRSQCTIGYVFRQSPMDAKLLAQDFADDALLDAPQLAKGEFLFVRTGEPARKMRLKL